MEKSVIVTPDLTIRTMIIMFAENQLIKLLTVSMDIGMEKAVIVIPDSKSSMAMESPKKLPIAMLTCA